MSAAQRKPVAVEDPALVAARVFMEAKAAQQAEFARLEAMEMEAPPGLRSWPGVPAPDEVTYFQDVDRAMAYYDKKIAEFQARGDLSTTQIATMASHLERSQDAVLWPIREYRRQIAEWAERVGLPFDPLQAGAEDGYMDTFSTRTDTALRLLVETAPTTLAGLVAKAAAMAREECCSIDQRVVADPWMVDLSVLVAASASEKGTYEVEHWLAVLARDAEVLAKGNGS